MCEENINIYNNYIEKREIEEQKKRDNIVNNLNKMNNDDKEKYIKTLDNSKFRENLKKLK